MSIAQSPYRLSYTECLPQDYEIVKWMQVFKLLHKKYTKGYECVETDSFHLKYIYSNLFDGARLQVYK